MQTCIYTVLSLIFFVIFRIAFRITFKIATFSVTICIFDCFYREALVFCYLLQLYGVAIAVSHDDIAVIVFILPIHSCFIILWWFFFHFTLTFVLFLFLLLTLDFVFVWFFFLVFVCFVLLFLYRFIVRTWFLLLLLLRRRFSSIVSLSLFHMHRVVYSPRCFLCVNQQLLQRGKNERNSTKKECENRRRRRTSTKQKS